VAVLGTPSIWSKGSSRLGSTSIGRVNWSPPTTWATTERRGSCGGWLPGPTLFGYMRYLAPNQRLPTGPGLSASRPSSMAGRNFGPSAAAYLLWSTRGSIPPPPSSVCSPMAGLRR
jgi:hypothetical protein